jgi:hypothetical protein
VQRGIHGSDVSNAAQNFDDKLSTPIMNAMRQWLDGESAGSVNDFSQRCRVPIGVNSARRDY